METENYTYGGLGSNGRDTFRTLLRRRLNLREGNRTIYFNEDDKKESLSIVSSEDIFYESDLEAIVDIARTYGLKYKIYYNPHEAGLNIKIH